jgi:hypothetical protein
MDSLRELYGHSSKLMTEKYAKIIKEVYRKDIMDNSLIFNSKREMYFFRLRD